MPDPKAQIPTPDEIIGPAIDKLVELRPRALAHINRGQGRYANIFAGWRAQAALAIERLADFALNGRIPFATGDALKLHAASEYDTLADLGATRAVGSVTMTRAAGRDGGAIRKGGRFRRPADETSRRLWLAAEYEIAVDVAVSQNQTSVTVPIVALREGPHANRPMVGDVQNELEIADEIFDREAWTLASYEAGGGANAAGDSDIQTYALAYGPGRFGPNDRAAIAGALRAGVKHVIAFDDPATATLWLVIADVSWAGSTRWAKLVRQSLYDNKRVGFGCRVETAIVTNQLITAEVTARARDTAALVEQASIEASIQKALRSYFDDRPDWNRWRLDSARGVVARADRRLQSCSSVVIKTPAGAVLTEPPASSTTHYMLLDNGVKVTLASPT